MTKESYLLQMEKFNKQIMDSLINLQEAKMELLQLETARNKFIRDNKKVILPKVHVI